MTTSDIDMADAVPDDVAALIDEVQHEEDGEFPVERGYIWTSASSVENANPLFWDDDVAAELTDGPIAMPTMLSLWFRPHHWAPGRSTQKLPLQAHFDLKERFALPEAVMSDNSITFYEPVRPGDLLRTHQVLRSVSGPKTTKLGSGRFWVIEVIYQNQRDEVVGVESYTGFGYRRAESTAAPSAEARTSSGATAPADDDAPRVRSSADAHEASTPAPRLLHADVAVGDQLPTLAYPVTATTIVLGALAARDWRPMHHDHDFAVNRNGTRDIFLNTPNQAAWFERYVTDWTGPTGRLGKMTFRMLGSVFPGNEMHLDATVTGASVDDVGCSWADLDVALTVDGDVKTTCAVRVALPIDDDDNPWRRRDGQWMPDPAAD